MLRRIAILSALTPALCVAALASPDQWVEVSSPHFRVLTDSNEKQARHILDQFERMRWMFQTLFPKANVDPAAPIVVLAAKNGKSFEALEPEPYLAKGQLKVGGYFMQAADKNYILLRLDAEQEHPFASIYHEYTHLQFSSDREWLPLWLNEGLAEFMQNTEFHDKDVVLGEPSADDIFYLRQNRLIPLDVLFKVDAKSPYYHEEQKGSVFYAESWALTHYLFLTDRHKGTNKVGEYMTLLSSHQDPVVAGEKVFGDLKQLRGALEDYIQQRTYGILTLSSAAAPIDESSYKTRLLTQTDSDAVRADVLAYVQRTKDARALLDEVLKADPSNAQAHETMGFLEFRDGHMDEARKWYGEAVKLDSQSYLAHYYFASMSMGDTTADQDKEIEASLLACIRLNPRFSPAYDELASFYGRRREHLEEAHKLNLEAIQLDPGNIAFRMNAANVLMTMDRYDDASNVLRTTLKLTGNSSQVEMVESRLVQLKQIQSAQAQARASEQVAPQAGHVIAVAVDPGPKHPTEPATGPRHEAIGIMRGVKCSYPSVIDFRVEGVKKIVSLYSNNYFKIDLSVLGFTPTSAMNPCGDFEGRKARVQYAESEDKTVDGQVIAIELRK